MIFPNVCYIFLLLPESTLLLFFFAVKDYTSTYLKLLLWKRHAHVPLPNMTKGLADARHVYPPFAGEKGAPVHQISCRVD